MAAKKRQQGKSQMIRSLTPLVNEIKQKCPDLFEIDRMDYPVELSLTVGELRRILFDSCYLDGFLAVLKRHRLNFIGSRQPRGEASGGR